MENADGNKVQERDMEGKGLKFNLKEITITELFELKGSFNGHLVQLQ